METTERELRAKFAAYVELMRLIARQYVQHELEETQEVRQSHAAGIEQILSGAYDPRQALAERKRSQR